MKKRAIALVLWFGTGWYAGAFLAWALGTTALLAPAVAVLAAAVVAGDPWRVIWSHDRV